MREPEGFVDLHWIPLGAGADVVHISGKVFEALAAFIGRRSRYDLYHSALIVRVPEGRFVIEQAPVPKRGGPARGVVAEGPVGIRLADRFRLFRYEVRCWRDGEIPDLRAAIGGPVRVSDSVTEARSLLQVLPSIPRPVWGRDGLRTGEMWNSNSVVSWALVRSGIDVSAIQPPPAGRAPGWHAGMVIAQRGNQSAEKSGFSGQDPAR